MFKKIIYLLIPIIIVLLFFLVSFSNKEDLEKAWQIKEIIPSDNQVVVGEKSPDFIFFDEQSNEIKLSDYQGKIVFLNFWASWCPPCRAEMPDMEYIQQTYSDQLVILAINLQEEANVVQEFMKSYNLSFKYLLDTSGQLAQRYHIRSIPTSIFLDKQGYIREKHLGTMNINMIENAIKKASI